MRLRILERLHGLGNQMRCICYYFLIHLYYEMVSNVVRKYVSTLGLVTDHNHLFFCSI